MWQWSYSHSQLWLLGDHRGMWQSRTLQQAGIKLCLQINHRVRTSHSSRVNTGWKSCGEAMHSISTSTDIWDQKSPACSANITPPATGDCISTLVPIVPKKKKKRIFLSNSASSNWFKIACSFSKLPGQHPTTKKVVWCCSRYFWALCWHLLMLLWSYGVWKGPAALWVIHTVFIYVLQRGDVLFRRNWGVKENITVLLKLLITQKGK